MTPERPQNGLNASEDNGHEFFLIILALIWFHKYWALGNLTFKSICDVCGFCEKCEKNLFSGAVGGKSLDVSIT